jgi:hypothetical protein
VIEYINHRKCQEVARNALLFAVPRGGWKCIPETISRGPCGIPFGFDPQPAPSAILAQTLTVAWTVLNARYTVSDRSTLERIIDKVSQVSSSIAPTVLALARMRLITAVWQEALNSPRPQLLFQELIPRLGGSILTSEDANVDPLGTRKQLEQKYAEANLIMLVAFLESCVSGTLPFKAVQTIRHIGNFHPQSSVPYIHQRRFASAFNKLFDAGLDSDWNFFLTAVLEIGWLEAYRNPPPRHGTDDGHESEAIAWLDDLEAGSTLKHTIVQDATLRASLQEIVTKINDMHSVRSHGASEASCLRPS